MGIVNYRTSEEIKRMAVVREETFDREAEAKNGYVSLFHGPAPEYRTFPQRSDE